MAILLLLAGILGGMTGVGAALYLGLSWIMILGAYVLGGMIGSMTTITIAVTKSDRLTPSQSALPKSVAEATG